MPERDYQEISQAWAKWLAEHLGPLRQVDLVARSDGALKPALVSRWMRGDHAPSAENAIVVARVLGTDLAETLRAAGHHSIADVVQTHAPTPGPDDPMMRRIMTEPGLAQEDRDQLAGEYLRGIQENRERFARQLSIAVAVRRRARDEAARGATA